METKYHYYKMEHLKLYSLLNNCLMKYLLLFVTLFSFFGSISAQTGYVLKNDICLPSKQYMLTGVQNDMFIQTFLRRWRPYNDFVDLVEQQLIHADTRRLPLFKTLLPDKL